MCEQKHPSDSQAQRDAEEQIFAEIQKVVAAPLAANPTIPLPGAGCSIRPDFYSQEPPIVGEIFSHLGAPKVGQAHKLAADILKMLLLERTTGRNFRKIVAICDRDLERHLLGNSWLAESIRQFGIELIRIELDDAVTQHLRTAQFGQRMVNPEPE